MVFTSSWKFLALFTLLCYITAATSKFNGVNWDKQRGRWRTVLTFTENGKRIWKEVGLFQYELDAAKALNEMCEKYGIEHRNREVNGIPQQKTEKYITAATSKFHGVHWDKKKSKWRAFLNLKENGKRIYKQPGVFENQVDAAKAVNEMCEQYGLPHKNWELNGVPQEKPNKPNQYVGVSYSKNVWKATLCIGGGGKSIHGGFFPTQEQAAMKVNEMCDQYGLERKNPQLLLLE